MTSTNNRINRKVGVITPIKNEQANLSKLIKSMKNQSLRPFAWVIVDDGSTDGSANIISEVANSEPWVHHVENQGAEGYEMGANYAKVLNTGFQHLLDQFGDLIDYYMVLDGDMVISDKYIESIIGFLEQNSSVVIASGGIYIEKNGNLELEERSDMHPAGGATLYEGEFYRTMGGPPLVPGVDSVMEAKARIHGNLCRYLTDMKIKAIQTRPTGSKGNVYSNAAMRGSNNYALHMNPAIVLAKTLEKSITRPYLTGVAFLIGYLKAFLYRHNRISDEDLIRYYRKDRPLEIVDNFINR